MYRAEIIGNKIIAKKYHQRQYNLHREQLRNIKSTLPTNILHPKSIIRCPKGSCESSLSSGRTQNLKYESVGVSNLINKYGRNSVLKRNKKLKNEMEYKINQENMNLLKRIMEKQSQFSASKWAQEENKRRNYVRMGCVYPTLEDRELRKRNASFLPNIRQINYNKIHDNSLSDSENLYNNIQNKGNIKSISSNIKVLRYEVDELLLNKRLYDVKMHSMNGNLIITMKDSVNGSILTKTIDGKISNISFNNSKRELWKDK